MGTFHGSRACASFCGAFILSSNSIVLVLLMLQVSYGKALLLKHASRKLKAGVRVSEECPSGFPPLWNRQCCFHGVEYYSFDDPSSSQRSNPYVLAFRGCYTALKERWVGGFLPHSSYGGYGFLSRSELSYKSLRNLRDQNEDFTLCTAQCDSASEIPSNFLRTTSSCTLAFRLYNSCLRKKCEVNLKIDSVQSKLMKIYSCGPTLHDDAHLGNLRTFMMVDLLKRWLKARGSEVFHVCNLTDVDDKIIHRAMREMKTGPEVTSFYERRFMEDLQILNVLPAQEYPRVTDHIPNIISFIEALITQGFAYESQGSVYFKTEKHGRYGFLSNRMKCKESGASKSAAEDAKDPGFHEKFSVQTRSTRDSSSDFALWKAKTEDIPSEFSFESPWGKGRPGWHTECSTLLHLYFQYDCDIHTGGIDLLFPHHENSLAQLETLYGKPLDMIWLHCGMLMNNQRKMSKSEGNYITLKEALELMNSLEDRNLTVKQSAARTLRYFLIRSHYRIPLSFSTEAINSAKQELARLENFYERLCMHINSLRSSSQRVRNLVRKDPPVSQRFGTSSTAAGCGENGMNDEADEEKKDEDAYVTNISQKLQSMLNDASMKFVESMNDDLNTPRAISELLQLIKSIENSKIMGLNSKPDDACALVLADIQSAIEDMLSVLGLELERQSTSHDQGFLLWLKFEVLHRYEGFKWLVISREELQKLMGYWKFGEIAFKEEMKKFKISKIYGDLLKRFEARMAGNFAKADEIRCNLEAEGYKILDFSLEKIAIRNELFDVTSSD